MNVADSVALSSQMALMRQMDAIANNLANQSTTAFKAEHLVFSEYLAQSADGSTSYVTDVSTARDPRQGPIAKTANPLDVALHREAYLAVDTPLGVRYTRNGHFQIDAQGQIVTSQGYPVLDGAGNPITIPSDATDIAIGEDGTVATAAGIAGRLQLVTFANVQALAPAANEFYVTDQTPQPTTDAKVVQGALEESNVQPILEITHLMAVARSVAFAKDFTDTDASLTSTAIDRLGKLP